MTDSQPGEPDHSLENNWPATFLAQTAEVAVLLDQSGRFVALNPAAEKLFGRSATDLIGHPFTEVLEPLSHKNSALMLARVLAEGSVTDWELVHPQAGGPPVRMCYTAIARRDATGQLVDIAALGCDLTAKTELTGRLAATHQQLESTLRQLEKAQAQLKAAQAQLVQSEKMRALGQLVAGVAHEINNPAASVMSNLAQLARLVPALRALVAAYAALKPVATPEQLAAIAAAEATAEMRTLWPDLPAIVDESREGMERIRNIVLSFRKFSRVDEAELKEANLNDGLASTLHLVRPLCQHQIEITEDYGALPPVLCHPGEINQVFLNLLTNAIQAIDGPGHIWVSSRREMETVQIIVRDTGSGMSPETLARLGEPFFTTKPVGTGVGLGLAISFGIVQRHQGRLRFESAPGRGTSAIVELPLLPSQ